MKLTKEQSIQFYNSLTPAERQVVDKNISNQMKVYADYKANQQKNLQSSMVKFIKSKQAKQ